MRGMPQRSPLLFEFSAEITYQHTVILLIYINYKCSNTNYQDDEKEE